MELPPPPAHVCPVCPVLSRLLLFCSDLQCEAPHFQIAAWCEFAGLLQNVAQPECVGYGCVKLQCLAAACLAVACSASGFPLSA